MQRAAEQFNGREGETATLLSNRSFYPKLARGGFAPRHLSRYLASLRYGKKLVMSEFDGLLKGIFGEAEPIELEFTRMLLDVRGCTNDEVKAFFRKIGKHPVAIGEPIEVSHSRQFTRVPGLFRPIGDDYSKAVDSGARKHQRRLGWIYDLASVMQRTSMTWENIAAALESGGASFGYLLGVAVHHEKVDGGQEATVFLTIQPFRLEDADVG